jgi:putative ABC transport system permease protein
MAALRDAGQPGDRRTSRIRNSAGLSVTAVGALVLVAAAKSSSSSTGGSLLGLGVLTTLIGAVLIGPMLAGFVIRVLGSWMPRVYGPVGMLAQRNALRNPRRTGATAAALMIGLALVAGLSVVGSSLVNSATSQMDQSVGADFIITTQGGLVVTPEVLAKAQATPGLAHVTENKFLQGTVDGTSGAPQKLEFVAASSTMLDDFAVKTVSGDLGKVYSQDGIALPNKTAVAAGLTVGSQVTVQFKNGTSTKLPLVAITTDQTVFNNGAGYVSIPTLAKSVPTLPDDVMLFAKADKGQEVAAYQSLQASLAGHPEVTVKNQTDYKKLIHDQVGQLLNMVYGLLGLAIVVAILGVVNTLALSVVERTREIGLIRAIGLSRKRLRRMIRLESIVIALFGAVLGVGLGLAWGVTAQKVMAGIGLTVLSVPVGTIVTVFIGAAFVGLLAALAPAFRASRMNVLGAIAADG